MTEWNDRVDEAPPSPDEYCRKIEAYLCRKNEGHLVRIVGPVFEQVSGWAREGIPLNIAFRGIDRYCQRYYARGPQRWPVRIEFCESDIRQACDEWRRAVGVLAGPRALGSVEADLNGPSSEARPALQRTPPLPAHLDRLIVRLSSMLASMRLPPELREAIERATREIDVLRGGARGLRGAARQQVIERLASLEREVLEAGRSALPQSTRATLLARASSDLASFRGRMAATAFDAALEAATLREVRDHLGLPQIALE
jgi:hypothetical protein